MRLSYRLGSTIMALIVLLTMVPNVSSAAGDSPGSSLPSDLGEASNEQRRELHWNNGGGGGGRGEGRGAGRGGFGNGRSPNNGRHWGGGNETHPERGWGNHTGYGHPEGGRPHHRHNGTKPCRNGTRPYHHHHDRDHDHSRWGHSDSDSSRSGDGYYRSSSSSDSVSDSSDSRDEYVVGVPPPEDSGTLLMQSSSLANHGNGNDYSTSDIIGMVMAALIGIGVVLVAVYSFFYNNKSARTSSTQNNNAPAAGVSPVLPLTKEQPVTTMVDVDLAMALADVEEATVASDSDASA